MIKEKITKEFVLDYMKKYFEENNKAPLSTDKKHPFSAKTVSNKFGTWGNALKIAGLLPLKNDPLYINCTQCGKLFKKLFNQYKRSANHFCSRNYSGTYTNKHRKTGNRISKLEIFLQSMLEGYRFEYNNRNICDGLELDIFIPELKLAFEINGIVHYKPIYGEEKFNKIKEKDILKNKSCKDKNIIIITVKDESIRFSKKYGKEILSRIYEEIHKLKFKNVLTVLRSSPNKIS